MIQTNRFTACYTMILFNMFMFVLKLKLANTLKVCYRKFQFNIAKLLRNEEIK